MYSYTTFIQVVKTANNFARGNYLLSLPLTRGGSKRDTKVGDRKILWGFGSVRGIKPGTEIIYIMFDINSMSMTALETEP